MNAYYVVFFLFISILYCSKREYTDCYKCNDSDALRYDSMLNVARLMLNEADSLIIHMRDTIRKDKYSTQQKTIILSPDRPHLHTLKINNYEQQID